MSGSPLRGLRSWLPILLVVVLAGLLPLVAGTLRAAAPPSCATDGVPLEEPPVARITLEDGGVRSFCCVLCTRRWIAATSSHPTAIFVRDEASGALIDSRQAHFAWSPVLVQPATGDRTHAFADLSDAEQHVRSFRGHLLSRGENPFVDASPAAERAP